MKDKIIVFDIDGTLADCEHRRHWISNKPKNWNAFFASVGDDPCIESVACLARNFKEQGAKIVLCSGRPDYERGVGDIRDMTENWLAKNNIDYDCLFMRNGGDYRPDDQIKLELLESIKDMFGEPDLWFDDRDRVVKAIRSQGIKVFQVADGDF